MDTFSKPWCPGQNSSS